MVDGYRLNEIAHELGQSPSWVSERLDELRNEILLRSGRFFPLQEHEREALKQSISDHGVQTPIVIGEHIPLIDGRHRHEISLELRLTEIPAVFLSGFSPEEEHELSVALNAARRQLGQAQKRSLIRNELSRDPLRSDRRIAGICGTDHKTVAEQRTQMGDEERTHQQEHAEPGSAARSRYEPEHRLDSLGRAQPAPGPRRAAAEPVDGDTPLGHAACAHGVRHAILRDGDGYRLEAR